MFVLSVSLGLQHSAETPRCVCSKKSTFLFYRFWNLLQASLVTYGTFDNSNQFSWPEGVVWTWDSIMGFDCVTFELSHFGLSLFSLSLFNLVYIIFYLKKLIRMSFLLKKVLYVNKDFIYNRFSKFLETGILSLNRF